jgi:hypothetical protein
LQDIHFGYNCSVTFLERLSAAKTILLEILAALTLTVIRFHAATLIVLEYHQNNRCFSVYVDGCNSGTFCSNNFVCKAFVAFFQPCIIVTVGMNATTLRRQYQSVQNGLLLRMRFQYTIQCFVLVVRLQMESAYLSVAAISRSSATRLQLFTLPL